MLFWHPVNRLFAFANTIQTQKHTGMSANKYPEIDAINLKTISPEEFQRLCKSFIISLAHRRGLDFGECEDVFQEIMVKVFMKNAFRNFNPECRLTAYLATVVQREASERRTVLARISATDPETLTKMCDAECLAESPIKAKKRIEYARDLVRRGLDVLRGRIREPKQVEALIMHDLEGKSTEETARRIGESVEYVHLACHRGRKRLAEIIPELIREEEDRKFCA